MHALCKTATFPFFQTTTIGSHLLAPTDLEGEALAKATQTQNLLSTPKHIATLVVNTLFTAIVEATNASATTVPEKMTVWFKAYRYCTHIHHHMLYIHTYIHTHTCTPPPNPLLHTYTQIYAYILIHTQRLDDFFSSEEECL